MQPTEHLDDCPFCGDDAGIYYSVSSASYHGYCNHCGATGPIADSREEAANRWNHPKAVLDNAASALTLLDENRALKVELIRLKMALERFAKLDLNTPNFSNIGWDILNARAVLRGNQHDYED
jgi:Lar family restriction alleviation protein